MGKPSAKQEVTDYRMSLHYGLNSGPMDALLGIYYGEKEIWSGEVTEPTAISINKPDLFGGNLKEGGCVGTAYWLPGGPTQVMPDHLAARFGLSSDTCPAFRGVSTIFFHGSSGSGFMWGSNNPYLRGIWTRERRSPKALATDLRMIGPDANPAAIIYECLTNTDWGMGAGSSIIDTPSFEYAARVLRDEEFGLTMEWTRQTTIQDFVSEVIDHIQANLYVNPRTGRLTLKLIRDDYTPTLVLQTNSSGALYKVSPAEGEVFTDLTNRLFKATVLTPKPAGAGVAIELEGWNTGDQRQLLLEDGSQVPDDMLQTAGESFFFDYLPAGTWRLRTGLGESGLPALNPSNCKVTSFDRKAWGETTNEIVVTWTNPENEQEETVSAQDLANITIQGEIISDSRNYYGIRNSDLAMQVAMRDLAAATAPLATFEIEVDRSAWDFVPGGCVELTYPEEGIDGLILRLGKIDYGKPGQPKIKLNAMEDIFSLPISAYTAQDSTRWEDPSADPTPLDYVRVITAPAYFIAANLDAAQVDALSHPEVLSAIIASQDNSDTVAYDIVQQTTLPNGDVVGEVAGVKPILGHALLPEGLPAEAESLIPAFSGVIGGTRPAVAGFVFIGGTTEPYQEIALIQSVSEAGWVLKRGVLDTVPRAWPSDTQVWFLQRDTDFLDTTAIRSEAETVRYKLLPRTSRGRLAEADAPVVGAVMTARPYLPMRPANVIIGGAGFGSADLSDLSPTVVSVTWANRNRLMEDTQVLSWTDGTLTPEVGQTTTITLRNLEGEVVTVHDGLTGTSFDIPVASFDVYPICDITVTAERDGMESLQGHTVRVKWRPLGFGDDWGSGWGGEEGDGSIPPPPPPPTGGGDDPDPGTDFPDIPDQYELDPV